MGVGWSNEYQISLRVIVDVNGGCRLDNSSLLTVKVSCLGQQIFDTVLHSLDELSQ